MRAFVRRNVVSLAIVGSLALAASSGYLVATALGVGAQAPTKTTTIDVATGETGPQGVPGPAGPPGAGLTMKGTVATPADLPATGNNPGDAYVVSSDGSMRVWDGTKWVSGGPVGGTGGGGNAENCPSGSTFTAVVVNAPGGHVTTLWVCVKD
jgi:hypothetical protein